MKLVFSGGIVLPEARTRTGDYIYQGLPGSEWWWREEDSNLVAVRAELETALPQLLPHRGEVAPVSSSTESPSKRPETESTGGPWPWPRFLQV